MNPVGGDGKSLGAEAKVSDVKLERYLLSEANDPGPGVADNHGAAGEAGHVDGMMLWR